VLNTLFGQGCVPISEVLSELRAEERLICMVLVCFAVPSIFTSQAPPLPTYALGPSRHSASSSLLHTLDVSRGYCSHGTNSIVLYIVRILSKARTPKD
jgi:hypothetical protein